ncbi:MAG: DUF6051 family protein, partial [Deltaproteobacteria bacterium]|nr:DUF6051 family protein [Deltaproteobacteria bacterium]
LSKLGFVSQWAHEPPADLIPPPPDLLAKLPPGTNLESLFSLPDRLITENKNFLYPVMAPEGGGRSGHVVILLHGFNERHWDKYLPMAARLAGTTGATVILFPIAFHMNRAPAVWNNSRVMQKVSQWRKGRHPDVLESTLSNVAISYRLQAEPSHFLFSGLESYQNILSLVREIRAGGHPLVEPSARIDFFTYSIGSFLGEIIMLTNEDNLFDQTRFAAFCGGPVFNRLSPVSKFILDSEANVAVYSFLIEHLAVHRRKNPVLDELLSPPGAGPNFCAMLNYQVDREYREARLRDLADRILAVTLTGDEVVPPYEVRDTLLGAARDIPARVLEFDPPYPCRHEDPFPTLPKHEGAVDECFDQIFTEFTDFLR